MAAKIGDHEQELLSDRGHSTEGRDDGVSVLSTLLLSVLLKLEDREYRVTFPKSPHPKSSAAGARTLSRLQGGGGATPAPAARGVNGSDEAEVLYANKELIHEGDGWTQTAKAEGGRRVVFPHGDTVAGGHPFSTSPAKGSSLERGSDAPPSPPLSRTGSDENKTEAASAGVKAGVPEDIVLMSQSGDTSSRTGSAYRESAVNIVTQAILRAIANIFINGVVRRSLRAFDPSVATYAYGRGKWLISTSVCGGDEQQEGAADGGESGVGRVVPTVTKDQNFGQANNNGVSNASSQGTEKPQISGDSCPSESMRSRPIPPEWILDDVNRRIAGADVTINHADMIPPSVGSSCDVSRSSSVSVLSSGDRSLRVKAIPPTQSKLLWRMVQKMHGVTSSAGVLKKLPEEPSCDPEIESQIPTEEPPSDERSNLEREKAVLLARVPNGNEESQMKGTDSRDEWGQEDKAVSTQDSAAQTEERSQNDEVSESDGAVVWMEGAASEKHEPREVEASERRVKLKSVPPAASPLLRDVVWRHASHYSNCTAEDLKACYVGGSAGERHQAKGVVNDVLCRAVSSLFVDRLISDSLASLSISHGKLQTDNKSTASFTRAVDSLTLRGFQWFPYLEETPAGPFKKAVDQRRARQDGNMDKQRSSETSDTYEDARDKFGSSDDLLDVKSQVVTSDDDEFADALGEAESHMRPETSDKSTQVSYGHREINDEIEDELKRDPVEVELPLDSINYMKDQFNDVKALVVKYREMLYALPDDEAVTGESPVRQETTVGNTEVSADHLKVPGGKDESETKQKHEVRSKRRGKEPIKETSNDTEVPSTSRSSQTILNKGTSKELDVDKGRANTNESSFSKDLFSLGSIYDDTSSEDPKISPRQSKPLRKHKTDKSKDKGENAPPARGKVNVPGKLRQHGQKPRTPAGRSRMVTSFRERTTPDGFLPETVKTKSKRSSVSEKRYEMSHSPRRQPPVRKRIAKSEEKPGMSSQGKEEATLECLPEVKNRISFFEKISRHKTSEKDTPTSGVESSPRSSQTPVKQAVSTLDKLEGTTPRSVKQKMRGQKQKKENDADVKKRIDFRHLRQKLTGIKKDSKRKSTRTTGDLSGVDSTTGKGIWANAAFFEALGEMEDPIVETKRSAVTSRRVLSEELQDQPMDEESVVNRVTQKHLEAERDTSRDRSPERDPKKANEGRETPSSGKRSRNRNANALETQLKSSTDDSCISSLGCSDTTMSIKTESDMRTVVEHDNQSHEASSERGDCYKYTGIELGLAAKMTTNDDEVLPILFPENHIKDTQDILVDSSKGNDVLDTTDVSNKLSSDTVDQGEIDETDVTRKRETDEASLSSCNSIELEERGRITSPSPKRSSESLNRMDPGIKVMENKLYEDNSPKIDQEQDEPSEHKQENDEAGKDPHCDKIQRADQQVEVVKTSSQSLEEELNRMAEVDRDDPQGHHIPEYASVEQDFPRSRSPSPTRDLEDVSNLNESHGPPMASSQGPRGNLKSPLGSIETEETYSSHPVPEEDRGGVVTAFGNASFIRACNSDDIFESGAEDGSKINYDAIDAAVELKGKLDGREAMERDSVNIHHAEDLLEGRADDSRMNRNDGETDVTDEMRVLKSKLDANEATEKRSVHLQFVEDLFEGRADDSRMNRNDDETDVNDEMKVLKGKLDANETTEKQSIHLQDDEDFSIMNRNDDETDTINEVEDVRGPTAKQCINLQYAINKTQIVKDSTQTNPLQNISNISNQENPVDNGRDGRKKPAGGKREKKSWKFHFFSKKKKQVSRETDTGCAGPEETTTAEATPTSSIRSSREKQDTAAADDDAVAKATREGNSDGESHVQKERGASAKRKFTFRSLKMPKKHKT